MISERHTGLVVKSITESLRFYCGLLGMVVIKDQYESGKFISNLSRQLVIVQTVKLGFGKYIFLELLEYQSPQPIQFGSNVLVRMGYSHAAYTVSNIEELYLKLSGAEVKFLSKPLVSPDGFAKVCFCQDFDGNFIELVEELQ